MTVPFAQLPLHYALQSGLSPQGEGRCSLRVNRFFEKG